MKNALAYRKFKSRRIGSKSQSYDFWILTATYNVSATSSLVRSENRILFYSEKAYRKFKSRRIGSRSVRSWSGEAPDRLDRRARVPGFAQGRPHSAPRSGNFIPLLS
jgi:hypothetical protein